jgi:hypothetical protein
MKSSKKKIPLKETKKKGTKTKTRQEGEPWIAEEKTAFEEEFVYDENEGTYVESHPVDDDTIEREDELES